jgi:hypothetical protein
MRYLKNFVQKHKNNGCVSLQGWFKKALEIGRIQKKKKANINELNTLSHHLKDDLGFDSNLQPLTWSVFSPTSPESMRPDRSAQKTCDCRRQPGCQNTVGCLS